MDLAQKTMNVQPKPWEKLHGSVDGSLEGEGLNNKEQENKQYSGVLDKTKRAVFEAEIGKKLDRN